MKHKKIFICICFIVCILFVVSSVNAGIFEFVDDTGEDDDVGSVDEDIDKDKKNSDNKKNLNKEKGKIKKFKLEISSKESVEDVVSELYEEYDDELSEYEDDYFKDDEISIWLEDFEDYVVYNSDDGNCIVIKESESKKIPNSNKYSDCVIKCTVVEHREGTVNDFYLVKNIKIIDKIKKESEKKSSKSSSSSNSVKSSSNDNDLNIHYVGNSNTGKFHAETCHDVNRIKSSNWVDFYSRNEAVNNGYAPCGHCRP